MASVLIVEQNVNIVQDFVLIQSVIDYPPIQYESEFQSLLNSSAGYSETVSEPIQECSRSSIKNRIQLNHVLSTRPGGYEINRNFA